MSFNLNDWIKIVQSYGIGYVNWFSTGMSHPSSLGKIASWDSSTNSDDTHGRRSVKEIAIFLVMSIFIGATIGSIIPDRPPISERAVVFVVVVTLWFFLSWLVHCACRILRGKAKFRQTTIVMLQLLAFVYVVSNFFTLIIVSSAKTYKGLENLLAKINIYSTGNILIGIQVLLLFIYVPLSISILHEFNSIKRIIVGLLAACFVAFFGSIVFARGGC